MVHSLLATQMDHPKPASGDINVHGFSAAGGEGNGERGGDGILNITAEGLSENESGDPGEGTEHGISKTSSTDAIACGRDTIPPSDQVYEQPQHLLQQASSAGGERDDDSILGVPREMVEEMMKVWSKVLI